MIEDRTPDPIPRFSHSPRWSSTTKLVVAITLVAAIAGLVLRFRQIIGPVVVAFILAYLLYPIAVELRSRLRFSWRLGVTILYLLVIILLVGLLTLGGLALVEQVQNLIRFLQVQSVAISRNLQDLAGQEITILWGLFTIDLGVLDLQTISTQLLDFVQPLLARTGALVGTLATGAATFIGWTFFAILVSYFILSDSGGRSDGLLQFSIPGYREDIDRMANELARIWNAFLRGQLIIIFMTIALYMFLLGTLGVKFYFGLALLAGLARFVPYVGPFVAWTTYALVCLLQGSTIFGMTPVGYALLVVGLAIFIDMMLDNYATPRLMGTALEVHPAAVMVAAIISANLFGVIGVVLAAPVLASVKLFLTYVVRKLFDLDPWQGMQRKAPYKAIPFNRELQAIGQRIWQAVLFWFNRLRGKMEGRQLTLPTIRPSRPAGLRPTNKQGESHDPSDGP